MRWEALSKTASAPVWTRRRLLVGGLAGLAGFFLAGGRRFVRAEPAAAFGLPAATRDALRTSPLVYVSPLQTDGSESRCHGEVWYCTDQGSVMIVTSADGWKAKAVGKGLHRARLWVGDFGAVRSAGDRYRKAPNFQARAEIVSDRAVFDRAMAGLGLRYPDEWEKWKPRFEKGYADGTRVLIRYSPEAA
jgi:hypothetical protein